MYTLHRIHKRFGTTVALAGADMAFEPGTISVVLGSSGAGKSTLLRILTGVEMPDEGQVVFDGEDVTRWPAQARHVALVTQDCALYPGQTVAGNLALALRRSGIASAERTQRIRQTLQDCDIAALADRRPDELSGGQLQRVALAKAVVRRPRLLALDEPFSQLDISTKTPLLDWIGDIPSRYQTTVVMVTHDPADAMRLGQAVTVMHAGQVIDSGTPADLYRRPRTRVSGSLMGMFGMNWLPTSHVAATLPAASIPAGSRYVGFRPEQFQVVSREATGDPNSTAASPRVQSSGGRAGWRVEISVHRVRDIGAGQLVTAHLQDHPVTLLLPTGTPVDSSVIHGCIPWEHLCWVDR